jgi:hypothetical protein
VDGVSSLSVAERVLRNQLLSCTKLVRMLRLFAAAISCGTAIPRHAAQDSATVAKERCVYPWRLCPVVVQSSLLETL